MQGITQMLGHSGPSHGDPLVAELLNRTYRGGREAASRFAAYKAKLATNTFDAPIIDMTLLHASWVAHINWQVALTYTDGIIVQHLADDLPNEAYKQGDTLCDAAMALNREAVRLKALHDSGGKINMSPMAVFPEITINQKMVTGAWAAYAALIQRINQDIDFLSQFNPSKRMQPVYADLLDKLHAKQALVTALERDWSATSMLDNRCMITMDLLKLAKDFYNLGQKLWAPYLIGPSFTSEYNRQPTLAEISTDFDPWMLTDYLKKKELQGNAKAEKELVSFWGSIADLAEVKNLHGTMTEALRTGKIRVRTGRGYPNTPWSPQFLVHSPVRFGSRDFLPGQLCSYFVQQGEDHKRTVEIRRSGRVVSISEALGQE